MAPKQGKDNYKGGFFDNIDIPAITSFLVCVLLFVLVLVGVKSIDYSSLNKTSLEDLPARVAKILMPLKPPGKKADKPKGAQSPGPGRNAAATGAGDASAAARIERSRKTVNEQIGKVQERITKAAVLSILSGTGPAAQGRPTGRAGKPTGFADWGDLDDKLGKIEGLTKFDAKSGSVNRDGSAPERTLEDPGPATSGIDKLVKGFQNAKRSSLTKIGTMELEKPELVQSATKYNGARNVQEIAAFISKKQSTVSMLYEERLKVNPSLEGKITVVLIIEEDGTVSSASILRSETTLDDSDFQSELLRRMKRWIFPPSTGGPVEMKSPFVFKPA
jgi:periplasmic protein TonB